MQSKKWYKTDADASYVFIGGRNHMPKSVN